VGYNLEDALQELDDCPVFEGLAKEYTEDYVDSCGLLDSLPEPVTVGRVRPLCLPDTQAVHTLTDTVKRFWILVASSWQSRRHDVVKTLLAAILMVLVAQTGLFYYGLMVFPYVDAEDSGKVYRGTDTE
jgi:hypothetical protein